MLIVLNYLPHLLLQPFILSGIHASPTAVPRHLELISSATNAEQTLEERQVLLGFSFGAFGVGVRLGRWVQSRRDADNMAPGLNKGPGSACFNSGSWSKQEAVS